MDLLASELDDYPDSYSALRTKWSYIRLFRQDLYNLDKIREDLASVDKLTTPDALVARTYLSLLCDDRESATAATLLAITQHPTSWSAVQALRDLRSDDESIVTATQDAISRFPGSWVARQALAVEWPRVCFELVEKVTAQWSEDEPLCPLPDLYLASSSLKCGVELDKGQAAAIRAINGFLRGDGRIAGQDTRGLDTAYIPWGWIVAAEIAEKRGDAASAIGFAKAYSAYSESSSSGYEVQGRVWEQLHDIRRAREAWIRSLTKGSNRARDQLKRLWPAEDRSKVRFEDWLTVELAKVRGVGGRDRAPAVQGEDLAGREVNTANMTGKVVVLNFWSLGCAPCKEEIPQLNHLVESYSGKSVEFIALAASDAAHVSEYLVDHPFRYRQLIGGEEIRSSMELSALPAHVVIDGRGYVVAKFTGASPAHSRKLQTLIDLALAELG